MTEPLVGVPLPLDGATRVFAIVGDPIAQAGSPGLFNAAFAARGVHAVLVPMHVSPESLSALVAAFKATRNWDGLVITVPHKVAVAGYVDELGVQARRTGAVNAIRKLPDGRLRGDNFDGAGFVEGLRSKQHHLRQKRILIVGSGGAGRAVAHAVADESPSSITLYDTDMSASEALRASVHAEHPTLTVELGPPTAKEQDVSINCTSLGMHADDPLPFDISEISPSSLVVDIVLKPAMTRLLEQSAKAGASTHQGLFMLSGQISALVDFFGCGKRIR